MTVAASTSARLWGSGVRGCAQAGMIDVGVELAQQCGKHRGGAGLDPLWVDRTASAAEREVSEGQC